jgi:tetratricopeptide (TPR) repeat protein
MTCRVARLNRKRGAGNRRRFGVGWFLTLVLLGQGLAMGAQVDSPPLGEPRPPQLASELESRLMVAILGFENRTRDPALEFWRFAPERLLARALGEAGAIRVVSPGGYALSQLHMKAGDPVDPARARAAGELLEASRVIWGSYERSGKKWDVTVHLLNTATGKTIGDAKAASTDWFKIRDELVTKILAELRVVPSPLEWERVRKRWATSSDTLELLSKAKALGEQGASQSEVEALVKHAVEGDPACGPAQVWLAEVLFNQGKVTEAEAIARRAVSQWPDYAASQFCLGVVLGGEEKWDEAEGALQMASRLDPTDAQILEGLGELYDIEHLGAKATQSYEQAATLNPLSSSIRAHLGYRHAAEGKTAEAKRDLKDAERLAPSTDSNAHQFLAYAYEELRDGPSALSHYEAMITEAKKTEMNPEKVRRCEERCRELKARLAPVFVDAAEPKSYPGESLTIFLQQFLNPTDLVLVTNPLAATAEMERWAHELTTRATNDLGKAKALFEALSHHVDPSLGGVLTAQQVFAKWNTPGVSFRCSEYATLYVSLSRACGLDTYCALVDEDASGNSISHECACLFLGAKALLIDPSWFWFGVPHRKFKPLNDVEATAVWLSQQSNSKQKEIACQLAPGLAVVHFNRIRSLIEVGDTETARRELRAIVELEPESQMALLAQGELELREGKVGTSVRLLEKAVAMDPSESEAQLFLGLAYELQGRSIEAREAFRKALPGEMGEARQEFARQSLARVNEAIHESAASQIAPKTAAGSERRGDSYAWKGQFDKAIADYTEALRLNPDDAAAYQHRAYARLSQGDMDKVISDCTEAIRLDPKDGLARSYRASAYAKKEQFAQAVNDLKEAVRLSPEDPRRLIELASMLANCSDTALRNGKEAVAAARKACELTDWKDWRALATLAAASVETLDFDDSRKYEEQADKLEGLDEQSRKEMHKWLATWRSRHAPTQPPNLGLRPEFLNSSGAQTNVDLAAVKQSAESGDANAQARLAAFLNEGSHGCATNHVEAYKWAALATYQGHKDYKYLVRELELFMTPADLSTAKASVQAYLESHPALPMGGQ